MHKDQELLPVKSSIYNVVYHLTAHITSLLTFSRITICIIAHLIKTHIIH